MFKEKTMLGEQIKQRRQQEKLTQRELAKLLNTSPANISKWENNKTQPKKEFLEQLQKLWNVSFYASKPEPQSQATEPQSQATEPQNTSIATNEQEIETNATKQQELIASNEQVQEVNKIDAIKQQELIANNEQEIETNASKQQEPIASNEQVQEPRKALSSGTVDFKKIIEENLYYIDKTYFISDLMRNHSTVNLITRPRRFGKSLTMSMLKYFFDINGDKSIFKGLQIEKDVECCQQHMGKYPVISITLSRIVSSKETEGFIKENFEEARRRLVTLVIDTAREFRFLLSSDKLEEDEKRDYQKLLSESMVDDTITDSLFILTRLLYKHYGKQVIVLVDEYDVPLQKAYIKKYYKQMVDLIRNFFSNTFKNNDYLQLGVITGCLRVSKEEIFTGFNNLEVYGVLSDIFNTAMGLTIEEVKEMMRYYNIEQYYNSVKEWYEGYKFYGESIFCPWDTILCCKQLCNGKNKKPKLYWTNTSHNQIVYDLLEQYSDLAKEDVETLLSGNTITKYINELLNYNDLDRAKNEPEDALTSVWSMLLMTGYLTAIRKLEDSNYEDDQYELKIPNYEIRKIYRLSLVKYLKKKNSKALKIMEQINASIAARNAETTAKYINEYLPMAYPIGAELHSGEKESDYQNILASVFLVNEWNFNREIEAGTGRCDFIIRMPNSRIGIIIEFKHAQTGKEEAFNNACNEALAQIEEKRYADYFAIEHPDYYVIHCGMAFYHQDCKVVFYDPQTKERKESGISGALVPASLEAKTTETASTKSSKETQSNQETEAKEVKTEEKSTRKPKAKKEPKAKESRTNKKSSKKTQAKEEPEAKEAKPDKKSSRKSEAKKSSDKKPSSKKAKESDTIRVPKKQQQIIKRLAERGMTAKEIAEIVELPEKIVKKYMK